MTAPSREVGESAAPFTIGFTVYTADLRQALSSVLVHAHPKPDAPSMHRVRLELGPENVEVSATDSVTAALAIVSVVAFDRELLEPIDLDPTDARLLLALFKAGQEQADDPQFMLHVEASTTHLRFTDVSGLFDGRSVTLLRLAHDENMPVLRRLFSSLLRRDPGAPAALAANGSSLALFKAATAAYKQPLQLECSTTKRAAVLLSCGESFLGALMPLAQDDEQLAEAVEWRRAWERRLPALEVAR